MVRSDIEPLYGWAAGSIRDEAIGDAPQIAVVVPMHNEEENAAELIGEIASALAPTGNFEIIAVNDASSDNTLGVLAGLKDTHKELRVLSHKQNAGQSRAVRTGIIAARAPIIATLDGDGQNDPADIPALFARLTRKDAPQLLAMIAGERAKRQDSAAKKFASRFANGLRKRVLKDGANDTGCGLKVFYRGAFLRLPFFDHIHRYLPALMVREGLMVEFMPVNHRPRLHGVSKYNNLNRALVAIRDMMGVIWLQARARQPGEIEEK